MCFYSSFYSDINLWTLELTKSCGFPDDFNKYAHFISFSHQSTRGSGFRLAADAEGCSEQKGFFTRFCVVRIYITIFQIRKWSFVLCSQWIRSKCRRIPLDVGIFQDAYVILFKISFSLLESIFFSLAYFLLVSFLI